MRPKTCPWTHNELREMRNGQRLSYSEIARLAQQITGVYTTYQVVTRWCREAGCDQISRTEMQRVWMARHPEEAHQQAAVMRERLMSKVSAGEVQLFGGVQPSYEAIIANQRKATAVAAAKARFPRIVDRCAFCGAPKIVMQGFRPGCLRFCNHACQMHYYNATRLGRLSQRAKQKMRWGGIKADPERYARIRANMRAGRARKALQSLFATGAQLQSRMDNK